MTPAHRRAIAWFRRDLRLSDNRMLAEATESAERAWPVFVADPDLLARHGRARARVAWYDANLRALDARLRSVGSGLAVLVGAPEEVLPAYARQVGAEAVFAAADDEPLAVARDERVARRLRLRLVDDQQLLPAGALRTVAGAAYGVYSPFRRALDARLDADPGAVLASPRAMLDRLAPRPPGVAGPSIFVAPESPAPLPEPGEAAATTRLADFVAAGMGGYREDRDRLDLHATSRLSPYLRVGAISVRACWRAALAAADEGDVHGRGSRSGALAWRGELAWREFFAHRAAEDARRAVLGIGQEARAVDWDEGPAAEEHLAAWRDGRTGYPLVDAGMRELGATGWMHNRARLVTASFLVKDLGIDWRRGESVFAELLLDADAAQNRGNWRWVAGVGTAAAPYFRVLNPTLQARRFDPDGTYLRRWLPELATLSDAHVHQPWLAPRPPAGYPAPIVDHAEARQRAIARHRQASSARAAS